MPAQPEQEFFHPSPPSTDQRAEFVADLLAVTLLKGVGPTLTARLLHANSGDPKRVLSASLPALRSVPGIGEGKARSIVESQAHAQQRAREAIDRAASLNVQLITIADAAYPMLLAEIPDPPPVLFVAGVLPKAEPAVAIVGTRSASHYGIEQAERFASALGSQGLSIVSGGARGIDTAAHRSALRAQARTVAVLGSGHANLYPEENATLFHEIVANRGAVISELAPDITPTAETFPRRNRIIAGLALGTLVVEAPARSGALITARQAVEEMGRDAMAIPNRIDSASAKGSNILIRDGHAAPVLEPNDVVRTIESRARLLALDLQIGETENNATSISSNRDTSNSGFVKDFERHFTESQSVVMRALKEPQTIDALILETGLLPADVLQAVTALEIQGMLSRSGQVLHVR